MKKIHLTPPQILWLCVFILGIGLFAADRIYCTYLANHWGPYSNWGKISYEDMRDFWVDDDDPHNKIDPALIYKLRSQEYKLANDDQKYNMRLSWAEEYRDKYIGRFTRLCVICFSLLFGAAGTFFSSRDSL